MISPASKKRKMNGGKQGGTTRNTVAAKNAKGLRHFSMKVCEKVREKGTTSYNEVADELVTEFAELKLLDPDGAGKVSGFH